MKEYWSIIFEKKYIANIDETVASTTLAIVSRNIW